MDAMEKVLQRENELQKRKNKHNNEMLTLLVEAKKAFEQGNLIAAYECVQVMLEMEAKGFDDGTSTRGKIAGNTESVSGELQEGY